MRTEVALQLGFCGLCLLAALLGEGMGVPLPEPGQVDCTWRPWSEWGPCDPCTKIRRRSRGIEAFGQFGGLPCTEAIGEASACTTDAVCELPPPPVCSATEFQCESGSCIKYRLKCNEDSDCEDSTDEDECEVFRRPCGTLVLDNNEQGRTAGYGINVLGSDPRFNPFNNDFFNGRCDRVMNPTTRKLDRLPWNVGVLNYETLVEETVSREIYESTDSLLKELLHEMSNNVNVGLSFKFTPTEPSMAKPGGTSESTDQTAASPVETSVSGNVGLDVGFEKKDMIKTVSEFSTNKKKSFVRVKGKVQLSTYRMRSRQLQVADEFVEHVKSLPLQYEKGIYFSFLEDYGTHYTKNGRSGGEYELIYVLDQDTITDKKITERNIQQCVKLGITAEIGTSQVGVGGHYKPEECKGVTQKDTDGTDGKSLVDKVMTSVRGGDVVSAVAMRAILNKEGVMDLATYQDWARTIPDIPALLHSEPESIHTLIPLDMPDANTRIANVKQATAEYVAEYSVCKCKPCHNGATLALLDGKCKCLCPELYEGLACQNRRTDKAGEAVNTGPAPTVSQEGNWSCWSGWSAWSGTRRTRTRSCNTEGLTGATCRGKDTAEEVR